MDIDAIKLNTMYGLSIGGLRTLAHAEPAAHTKKARLCTQLGDEIQRQYAKDLPRLKKKELDIAYDSIEASEKTYFALHEETGIPKEHLILNLMCFCIDSFKTTKKIRTQLNNVFNCFPGFDGYLATRSGERIWERVLSEIEILVAMKKPS